MPGFRNYVQLARKRGPDPFWTPVVPLHRIASFPLSYLYTLLRLTPLTVTFLGLALTLAGMALVLQQPDRAAFVVSGLVLLKIGVTHDYCDGEVARYRIATGKQSTDTHRAGIFADIWAYTIVIQATLPAFLGLLAWRVGAPLWWAWTGIAAGAILLAAYPVLLARSVYWPQRADDPLASPSFTSNSSPLLRLAGRAYFYLFETAMLTTHIVIALAVWLHFGGTPTWALAYVAFIQAGIGGAFLLGLARAFWVFDRPAEE